jgi:CheY-like chemotaxis protein
MHVMVDEAYTAQEGVWKIEKERDAGGYLCIIMDTELPGTKVFDYVRQLKTAVESDASADKPACPIIGYTKRPMEARSKNYLSAGLLALLPNPCSFQDLRKVMDQIMSKETPTPT